MKYPKQLVSGKPIDLTQYELGVIEQPKVDVFMGDYDLNDFIKPFFIEQTLYLDEKINELKMPLSVIIEVSKVSSNIYEELIKALNILYDTDDIKLAVIDEEYVIIIKKEGKGYAYINDTNFHELSDIVFEIMDYEKPKPEPKYEGDAELIKKVKEAEAKQRMKKIKDNILTLEIMIHDVMHSRRISYKDIKDWTVWQIKDSYKVEILREHKDINYLLASGGNYKVDLKKIKDWRKETKVVNDSLMNQVDS